MSKETNKPESAQPAPAGDDAPSVPAVEQTAEASAAPAEPAEAPAAAPAAPKLTPKRLRQAPPAPAATEALAPIPPSDGPKPTRFRLTLPGGEVVESTQPTIEDAIRELNASGRNKVLTAKSLKIELIE